MPEDVVRPDWLSRVLDSIPSEICVVDVTGRIVYVNEAWTDFARVNDGVSGCLAGADYLQVCDAAAAGGDEQARSIAQRLRGVLAGDDTPYSYEYPCHCASTKRWFRATITAMVEGGRRFAIVQHLDITARVLGEQQLAELETRHRLVVQSIAEGIVVTHPEGQILSMNPAAESILEAVPGTLDGRNLRDLLEVPEPVDGMRAECSFQGGRHETVALQVAVHEITDSLGPLLVWTLRDVSAARRETSRRRTEMGSLERLSRHAEECGSVQQNRPQWDQLAEQYHRLLDDALSAAIFGEYSEMAVRCAEFASLLAELSADPRDVVRLHTGVLHSAQRRVSESRARALADEGRLLLLRILADLGRHYKRRCQTPALGASA